MTVAEARTAGKLLVVRYAAEAIKREVAQAGPGPSPALARALAQLESAIAGQPASPVSPY